MNSAYKQNKTIQSKKKIHNQAASFGSNAKNALTEKRETRPLDRQKNYFEKNKEHSHARRNTR